MCQPSRVPFNTRAPRENLAALKHKIHQKCMKLTWGGEYLRAVPAWEPETMSGFLYPALTQRGIFLLLIHRIPIVLRALLPWPAVISRTTWPLPYF